MLTEPERRRLMDLGLPLTADLYRQLEQETAGIYAVAAGAGGFFCMTCGDGQPAAAFRRLARMLGRQAEPEALPPEDRVADVWDAGAGLAAAPGGGGVAAGARRGPVCLGPAVAGDHPGTLRRPAAAFGLSG